MKELRNLQLLHTTSQQGETFTFCFAVDLSKKTIKMSLKTVVGFFLTVNRIIYCSHIIHDIGDRLLRKEDEINP